MRRTCSCPEVPTYLYMVFKPYGASLLSTEPEKVLQGWINALQHGTDDKRDLPPRVWLDLRAAVLHQRRRSSDPAVNRIDAFTVVAWPLSHHVMSCLEEHLTEQAAYTPPAGCDDDPRDPASQNYKLSAEGLRLLLDEVADPDFCGLWMQLFTAERVERILETGWTGKFSGW